MKKRSRKDKNKLELTPKNILIILVLIIGFLLVVDFLKPKILPAPGVQIGLDLINPSPGTEEVNVSQNQFFNVTTIVSCLEDNCGGVNVTLKALERFGGFRDYLPNMTGIGAGWKGISPTNPAATLETINSTNFTTSQLNIISKDDGIAVRSGYECEGWAAMQIRFKINENPNYISNITIGAKGYGYFDGYDDDWYFGVYAWNFTSSSYVLLGNASPVNYQPYPYYTPILVEKVIHDPASFVNASGQVYISVYAPESYNCDGSGDSEVWLDYAYLSVTHPGPVSTIIGDIPFYTISENPKTISLNSGESQEIIWWVNASGELGDDGHFFVNAHKLDDISIIDRTSVWRVRILELTPPDINIISPKPKIYATTSIDFNISANEDLSSCLVSLNNWQTNYSLTLNSSLTGASYTNPNVNDGNYIAKFWCDDIFGNVNNTEQVSFQIDTIAPSISIVYPQSQIYSTYIGEMRYTYYDLNPGFCWYSNDLGAANSSSVVAGTNFTSLTSVEGNNNWILYCNDSLGNLIADSVSFSVDTIPPLIFLINPVDDYAVTADSVDIDFEYNVSDDHVSSCELNLNSEVVNYNASVYIDGLTNLFVNTTGVGEYFWNISCVDVVGNIENSSTWKFTIVAPIIVPPTGGGGGGGGGCADLCLFDGGEERECLSIAMHKNRTCGYFDDDTCLEWNGYSTTICEDREVCVDGHCIILDCIEDWYCDWTGCELELETGKYYSYPVDCSDLRRCGTEYFKPVKKECEAPAEPVEKFDLWLLLLLILLLILTIIDYIAYVVTVKEAKKMILKWKGKIGKGLNLKLRK